MQIYYFNLGQVQVELFLGVEYWMDMTKCGAKFPVNHEQTSQQNLLIFWGKENHAQTVANAHGRCWKGWEPSLKNDPPRESAMSSV